MKKFLLFVLLVSGVQTKLCAQIITTLQGTLATQTLSDPCYLLQGCVVVPNGVVLTINAGTTIFGDATLGQEGALIVEPGGVILANGTASSPIVFTSSNAPGSRQPGDWHGILIAGNAINNSGTFAVGSPCTLINAGGTNDNDNSGTLQYVQIHFAGLGMANDIGALMLASVGRGTTIDHIQITNSDGDGFGWRGGCVNTKYLISYDNRDDDFVTDLGFTGLSQFGVALRNDISLHHVSGSNGIESSNNNDIMNNYAGTPKTHPVFSNYSLFGPLVCNAAPVHTDFKAGAHIRKNSAHTLYNSYIAGWPSFGLHIQDDPTIANTVAFTVGLLNWSLVTFSNPTNQSSPAWSLGCDGISQTRWISGLGSVACRETGYKTQASIVGVGGLCVSSCGTPDFTMTGSTAQNGAPSFTTGTALTDLSSSFFDKTAQGIIYRGAFGSAATDWTVGWTNWCPQTTAYSCLPSPRPAGNDHGGLLLVPNPSDHITYAVFETPTTGNIRIRILDKVTGAALRVVNAQITRPGAQRIAFDVAGLQPGVYTVRVETAENVFAGQLMVR